MSKLSNKILIFLNIFVLSCSTTKITEVNVPLVKPSAIIPSSTVKVDIKDPVVASSIQPVIVSPSSNTEPLKISISNLSLKEGNSGSLVKLSGKNFQNLKLKDIVFINSAGLSVNSLIKNLSDTEVEFVIPDNTYNGLNSSDLANGFHNAKIFLVLENGEKIQAESFKVFFKPIISNSVNSSSSGNSNSTSFNPNSNVSLTVNLDEPKATGNVAVSINVNEPAKKP